MQIKAFFYTMMALLFIGAPLHAGDVDIKLTTNNGATKLSIQDSSSVDVSSITSDGNAYFQSVETTTGIAKTSWIVGDVYQFGSNGAGNDNYVAFPFTSAAAVTAKHAVVVNQSGKVLAVATASSNTVVGIAVSAAGGADQKVYVAVAGVVTGVTCQVAMGIGTLVCTSATTAGRIGTCSSTTTNGIVIGRMLTTCAAAGTGTVVLGPK